MILRFGPIVAEETFSYDLDKLYREQGEIINEHNGSDYQGSLTAIASQRTNEQSLEQVRQAIEGGQQKEEQDGRGHRGSSEDRILGGTVLESEGGIYTPRPQPGSGDVGGSQEEQERQAGSGRGLRDGRSVDRLQRITKDPG